MINKLKKLTRKQFRVICFIRFYSVCVLYSTEVSQPVCQSSQITEFCVNSRPQNNTKLRKTLGGNWLKQEINRISTKAATKRSKYLPTAASIKTRKVMNIAQCKIFIFDICLCKILVRIRKVPCFYHIRCIHIWQVIFT